MIWIYRENNVKPKDIIDAIDYIKNMQPLQQQKEDLENEIENAISKLERDYWSPAYSEPIAKRNFKDLSHIKKKSNLSFSIFSTH